MAEKIRKATHEAPLDIGGITIDCAVLEDGTRVLSRASFVRAMGRKGKVKGGQKYIKESNLPVFLAADNLKDFLPKDLESNSTPIAYQTRRGVQAMGYKYELLPQVCNVFLDAREERALLPNQEHIAERCKILSRGFALVGLAALIDEVTGYQAVRDKKALQDILDKYLMAEYAKWAKRFPDEFYMEMFRLRGWQWKGMKVNRPSVVGHYTNDIVYDRLVPGSDMRKQLRELNPKDEKGNKEAADHSFFTPDLGIPRLDMHLYAVVGLMRAAPSWEHFMRSLQRAFPKKQTTRLLPFSEENT
jgi:hypothetical protein